MHISEEIVRTREDFFYKLSSLQFNFLHELYRNLDNKINEMIKTVLTILPIVVGVGYFLLEKSFSYYSFAFFILTILSFTSAAIIGVVGHIPQKIKFLDPLTYYDRHYSDDLIDIVEIAAVTIGDDIRNLEIQCRNKAKMLKKMQRTIILGIVSMSIAFITLFIPYLMLLDCK